MDSDDYADKQLLEKTLAILEKGVDVVLYGTQCFYENGGRAEKRIRKDISDTAY